MLSRAVFQMTASLRSAMRWSNQECGTAFVLVLAFVGSLVGIARQFDWRMMRLVKCAI